MKVEAANASTAYKDGLFGRTIKKEVKEVIEAKTIELESVRKRLVKNLDIDALYENRLIPKERLNAFKDMVDRLGDQKWFEDTLPCKKDVSTIEGQRAEIMWRLERYAEENSERHACKILQDEIGSLPDAERCDLSDIFEGATHGEVRAGYGHLDADPNYWDADDIALSHEAFAEMSSAYTSNPDSLVVLKAWLPESVKVFNDIIKAIEGGRFHG